MPAENAGLPDNPKKAFEKYIQELERYYRWYERASNFNKIMWAIGQGTAILAGATTAFLVAVADKGNFEGLKNFLVLLPLIGAFAAALLTQTRVRDILALRERGRERIQALIDTAKAEYAVHAGSGGAEITALHKGLVDEVSRLEKEQAVDILSVIPVIGTRSNERADDKKQD